MDWFDTIIRTFFDFGRRWPKSCPNAPRVGLLNTLIISDRRDRPRRRARHGRRRHGHLALGRGCGSRPAIYTDLFRGLPAILTILLIGQGFARLSQSIFGPSPYPLGHHRAEPDRQRLHRRDLPRRHPERRQAASSRPAARSGMSYAKAMRLVVVPQGIRRVLPALVNQFIAHRQGLLPGLLPGPAGHRARAVPRRPGRRRPLRQPLAAGHGRHLLPGHHGAADPPGQLLRQPLPHRPARQAGPSSGLEGSHRTRRGLAADHREQHMSTSTSDRRATPPRTSQTFHGSSLELQT